MVKMHHDEMERERKKDEEERKRYKEMVQRQKRMLEASFDGDNDEIFAILKEVSKLFIHLPCCIVSINQSVIKDVTNC